MNSMLELESLALVDVEIMFLLFVEAVLGWEVPGVIMGVSLEKVLRPLDLVRNGKRLLFFPVVDLVALLGAVL